MQVVQTADTEGVREHNVARLRYTTKVRATATGTATVTATSTATATSTGRRDGRREYGVRTYGNGRRRRWRRASRCAVASQVEEATRSVVSL